MYHKLMKGNVLRKHSLHEKTAASVLLKLFISGLVHTVSDFSPGVASVWTNRAHTVATLGPHRSDADKHRINV